MRQLEEMNWNTIVDCFVKNVSEEECANKMIEFLVYVKTVSDIYFKKNKELSKRERMRKKIERVKAWLSLTVFYIRLEKKSYQMIHKIVSYVSSQLKQIKRRHNLIVVISVTDSHIWNVLGGPIDE